MGDMLVAEKIQMARIASHYFLNIIGAARRYTLNFLLHQ